MTSTDVVELCLIVQACHNYDSSQKIREYSQDRQLTSVVGWMLLHKPLSRGWKMNDHYAWMRLACWSYPLVRAFSALNSLVSSLFSAPCEYLRGSRVCKTDRSFHFQNAHRNKMHYFSNVLSIDIRNWKLNLRDLYLELNELTPQTVISALFWFVCFFGNPILCAICTKTFSKLCKKHMQWHVEECSLALLCN
jgi:hypothetical protein